MVGVDFPKDGVDGVFGPHLHEGSDELPVYVFLVVLFELLHHLEVNLYQILPSLQKL